MKQPTFRYIVNVSVRLCLGFVLVVAAVSKLLDLNEFSQRIGDFGLVYDALVTPAASAIVLAELLTGVSLVMHLRGSLPSAIALLLLFISVLTYGLALGLDVECGCFGPTLHVSLRTQLLIDFGLLLICFIIYWTQQRRSKTGVAADGPTAQTQNDPR